MSQDSITLINQVRTAYRQKHNAANLTLASLFAGATPPSEIAPYQLWMDTTDNVIRQRSAGTNVWVPLPIIDDDETFASADVFRTPSVRAVREGRGMTWSSPVDTTSGTGFSFASLPDWITEIELLFNQTSLTGADSLLVQLGTSGGLVTSGYGSGGNVNVGSGVAGFSSDLGFILALGGAGRTFIGAVQLRKFAADWLCQYSLRRPVGDSIGTVMGHGAVTLTGALTTVQLARTGTNTFDGGQIMLGYR